MSIALPASHSFGFQPQELPQKLSQASREALTGYWLCEFSDPLHPNRIHPLYLSLSEGQVVFSGNQRFSWHGLLKTLQRYAPRLRSHQAKEAILTLEQRLSAEKSDSQIVVLLDVLDELHQLDLVSTQDIVQALRLKILSDFDTCLFRYAGQAQFLPAPQLSIQSPILGFELEDLLSEARQRQLVWHKLNAVIPSMDAVPVLNTEAILRSTLSTVQKQRLESLVSSHKPLSEIALALAQDPLEIAKGFAQLVSNGLVRLELPASTIPQIVIVDDSPLILKQFKNLVTSWGYDVKATQDPATALPTMLHASPRIIFLDINMPGLSGFDLVKQIRRQPELSQVPLIMLTAEKTLSNNWRAQWSGCKFLTKPLTSAEVPQFQLELRLLLQELAPLEPHLETSPH